MAIRGQPARNIGAESSWLQIDTPEAGYAGSVVTLVARIARTQSGRAILEGIRASGGRVKIEKPTLTDPPNATVGREPAVKRPAPENAGVTPDCYIGFDPEDWPSPVDPAARSPEVILFLLLREAVSFLRAGGGADARSVSAEPDPEEAAAIAQFQRERSA
ncbi:MAG: hypothetical protein JO264_15495 [Acidisphaera sp.]|nr:hypothetical protein [Acidisphaera sp.]